MDAFWYIVLVKMLTRNSINKEDLPCYSKIIKRS